MLLLQPMGMLYLKNIEAESFQKNFGAILEL